jgi:hypothetical protein
MTVTRAREHVAHLRAHVGRADDHPVGRPRHAPLDRVGCATAGVRPPALVAAVLGGVKAARGQHVGVHALDPGDERVEVVARELRLTDAVDGHAVAVLDGGQPPAAAREHVHLVAVAHELLGQLRT